MREESMRRKGAWRRWRCSPAKIFLIFNLIIISTVFINGFQPNAFRKELTAKDPAFYNGQSLVFLARVCEEADVGLSNRRLTVCAGSRETGRVLVTTKLYPDYDYGDWLEISGQPQAPPEIEGFDYESYLARYDIYSVMYYAKIKKVAGVLTGGQRIYRRLIRFKQHLAAIINANLPEPAAGLANAILLGYRRNILPEDLDIFSRVGLSHMIAISGMHITILSAIIINFWLALGFSRRRALVLVFTFLLLYPFITGLSASAIRAAIMGGLAFLAFYYSRASASINALVFAAALMLVFNPRLLRNDIGFQLSFLALFGIIYIYPLGEVLSQRLVDDNIKLKYRSKKFLKTFLDTINLTLTSQIITLPVLLINFKQFSLIAPLSNVLIIWALPPLLAVLVSGFFATILFPAVGIFCFFPAYFLLKFIFISATFLATPKWAAVDIAWFNWGWGVLYYLILVVVIIKLRRRGGKKWRCRKKGKKNKELNKFDKI